MATAAMDELAERYVNRAVRSVFVYTREAHPGEIYGHHASTDDKRRNARAFRDHCLVRREILIDELDGAAHRAYGLLPNMTWIVGSSGMIHYKAAWTNVAEIAGVLDDVLTFEQYRAERQWIPFYSERTSWSARDRAKFRAGLLRSGLRALSDYERMLRTQATVTRSPVETTGARIAGIYTPGETP